MRKMQKLPKMLKMQMHWNLNLGFVINFADYIVKIVMFGVIANYTLIKNALIEHIQLFQSNTRKAITLWLHRISWNWSSVLLKKHEQQL